MGTDKKCKPSDLVVQVLKTKKEAIDKIVSYYLEPLDGFFKSSESSESKSISLIGDNFIQKALKAHVLQESDGNALKRFIGTEKIKKTYILNDNANFFKLNLADNTVTYTTIKLIKKSVISSFIDMIKYWEESCGITTMEQVEEQLKYNGIKSAVRDQLSNAGVKCNYNIISKNKYKNNKEFIHEAEEFLMNRISPDKSSCNTVRATRVLTKVFDTVLPTDSETFGGIMATYIAGFNDGLGKEFKTLKGDLITYYYKGHNYLEERGNLGNSCMRYSHFDPRKFELYSKNPNVVSMIALFKGNKIRGRAILWTTTTGKKVLDRIYYDNEVTYSKFLAYATSKKYSTVYGSSYTGIPYEKGEVLVDLDFLPTLDTPYTDSFCSRIQGTKTLVKNYKGKLDTVGIRGGTRNTDAVKSLRKIGNRKKPRTYKNRESEIFLRSTNDNKRMYSLTEALSLNEDGTIFFDIKNPEGRNLIASAKGSKSALSLVMERVYGHWLDRSSLSKVFGGLDVIDDSILLNGDKGYVYCKALSLKIKQTDVVFVKKYNDFAPNSIKSEKAYRVIYFISQNLHNKKYVMKVDEKSKTKSRNLLFMLVKQEFRSGVMEQLKKRGGCLSKIIKFNINTDNLTIFSKTGEPIVIPLDMLSPTYFQVGIRKNLTSYDDYQRKEKARMSGLHGKSLSEYDIHQAYMLASERWIINNSIFNRPGAGLLSEIGV